jgi:hypothetical protein
MPNEGRHPSARKQFRPRGKEKIDLIRAALEPFGLAKNDDKTWSTLAPVFVALAHAYNFQSAKGTVPRPSGVIQSLNQVEQAYSGLKKAAEAFVEAIGSVDDVALEWMLAYDDPVPLYARARTDADGPSSAPKTFKLLRDRVFGPEFKEYDRLAAQRLREFAAEIQPSVRERDAAAKELLAAREQFARRAAQSADRREIEQELRTLEQRERRYRLTELRVGAFIAPSPHFFGEGLKVRVRNDLDKMIRRQEPIATLAGQARERFAAASPKDEGGPSPLLGKSPKQRLAEGCIDLVFYAFGTAGLKHIKSSKIRKTEHSDFVSLLRAVHEFATGDEPSDGEFWETLKLVAALRDRYLKLLAPNGGKKTAANENRDADLKAAHARLSRESPP